MDRRTFVESAGLAAVLALSQAASAGAAELTDVERANLEVVTNFCQSWSTRDLSRILPALADDAVYRMSETTAPVTGHEGVRERLGSWMTTSDAIEFKILETFAKGPIVVTHRIDTFSSTTRPLTWEGVGVFFVQNGRIKEWSDFTIRVVVRPQA
jgi:limonene-1,2-epoxide hydrolase